MMLPTGDPLGTVVTMLATPFGRLDGLAIDTAGAGGWRPTGSPPDSPSEGVIDGLPGSVSFPRRKVVVDGPPWGKIVGQRSPDTAIAVAVEDGINHGSHLGLAWPPTGAGRRQEGLQDSPLLACQITGVWLRVHTLSTFETPLLEQTLSPRRRPAERLSADEWWVRDLADELGVSYCRFKCWVEKGYVHVRRVGRRGNLVIWADAEERERLGRLRDYPRPGRSNRYPDELTRPKDRPAPKRGRKAKPSRDENDDRVDQ